MPTFLETRSAVGHRTLGAPGAFPSRRLLLKWLLTGGVVEPDGCVLSWSNPDHVGFPYSEAAGIVAVSVARENGAARACARRIARHLIECAPESGGFGKNGVLYVFDTAVVLSALVAEGAGSELTPQHDKIRRMFDFVASGLEAGIARFPQAKNSSHWSDAMGCHLLKAPAALLDYARAFGPLLAEHACSLARHLLAQLIPLCDGRRFRIHAGSRLTYAHAHCYAVEGLLALANRGLFHDMTLLESCADWLADVQQPDGGIPPWHDGTKSWGEPCGDVAAQAVFIWCRVDRRTFAANISAALAFLARLQTPQGGLHYSPSSGDVNTWVTAFALDALATLHDRCAPPA